MTALISKPGLTSASALAIPTDWSASWFRSIISSLLQGGDVRNAVGVGCTVSGTIASPYATITVGGAGNPLIAPVIINPTAGQVSLTVIGPPTANNTVVITGPTAAVGNAAALLITTQSTANESFGIDVRGGTSSADYCAEFRNQSTSINIMQLRGDGVISGWGTTAGALVNMSPDTGSATLTGTGFPPTQPTCTLQWRRVGNLVEVNIEGLSGTSNATTFTLTGVPAAIQPATAQNSPLVACENNGVITDGLIEISAGSGTWTILNAVAGGAGFSAWTNAGTKQIFTVSFCYLLT